MQNSGCEWGGVEVDARSPLPRVEIAAKMRARLTKRKPKRKKIEAKDDKKKGYKNTSREKELMFK